MPLAGSTHGNLFLLAGSKALPSRAGRRRTSSKGGNRGLLGYQALYQLMQEFSAEDHVRE
jgi:hypothetical protein